MITSDEDFVYSIVTVDADQDYVTMNNSQQSESSEITTGKISNKTNLY
jgi:hypothetical protein